MTNRLQVLAIGAVVASVGCADPEAPLPQPSVEPQFSNSAAPFVARAVTTGASHACAIGSDRNVYCWGDNRRGQLGDGTLESSSQPVVVASAARLVSITSGGWDHTCGLTADGRAFCWGWNAFGQLGDGTTNTRATPSPSAVGLRFTQLDAGVYMTCGVTADGTVYCWGANAADGVDGHGLGAPTTSFCDNPEDYRGTPWPCSAVPLRVSGDVAFRTVSAGLWTACAIARSGDTYCWGWNTVWQLGNGSIIGAESPTRVAGDHHFDTISQGAIHGCGIQDTRAFCWGVRRLDFGQLGNGGSSGSPVPTAVSGGHAFSMISASDANDIFGFTCGLNTHGDAYCWGMNRLGNLGTDAPITTCFVGPVFGEPPCSRVPVPVAGDQRYIDLAAGREFACAVGLNRAVYCWGRNEAGQLGDGTMENRTTPVAVLAPNRKARPNIVGAGHSGERRF